MGDQEDLIQNIAKLFEETADNEKRHAKEYFEPANLEV